MKVFISQPMHGLTDEEVNKIRNDSLKYLKEKYGDVEILENYTYKHATENVGRLWYLGKSIQLLDQADAIYFVDGYEKANGCQVEELISKLYGIKILV